MQAFIQASKITNPNGLWLLHGEEPLIASWLMDTWRKQWQLTQAERKRYDLKSAKTWKEALSEFDALGLFSSQTVVELHGNHKPDKSGLAKLKQFCEQPDENCLVVIMPVQDYKAQKTVFFKQCQQLGNVIDTTLKNEHDRKHLLDIKAVEFGIRLQDDAWQMLLEQTQHNLLAAYQALWRVSDLVVSNTAKHHTTEPDASLVNESLVSVSVDALKPALVAQSRFNHYDLTEQILSGNSTKVVEILNYLKQSGEAPTLLLWNLAKDARSIIRIHHGASAKEAGVWRNQHLYQKAAQRVGAACLTWPDLLLSIDASIKGFNQIPVWESLMQLALSMSGKSLFLTKY